MLIAGKKPGTHKGSLYSRAALTVDLLGHEKHEARRRDKSRLYMCAAVTLLFKIFAPLASFAVRQPPIQKTLCVLRVLCGEFPTSAPLLFLRVLR